MSDPVQVFYGLFGSAVIVLVVWFLWLVWRGQDDQS